MRMIAAFLLLASTANAQQVMDGSDKAFKEPLAATVVGLLVGKTLDPYSAQIIRLRPSRDAASGDVCGLVNLKNQYGGYGGFQPFMVSAGNIFLQDAAQCR